MSVVVCSEMKIYAIFFVGIKLGIQSNEVSGICLRLGRFVPLYAFLFQINILLKYVKYISCELNP